MLHHRIFANSYSLILGYYVDKVESSINNSFIAAHRVVKTAPDFNKYMDGELGGNHQLAYYVRS